MDSVLSNLPNDAIVVKCVAPVNIAVIKYWGKRNTELNLPINSSLSGTIDIDAMCSSTIAIASKEYNDIEIYLNDEKLDIQKNKRMSKVLKLLRNRACDYIDKKTRKVLVRANEWSLYGVRIISSNNFPTAAGLASSASGYACLTRCLASLYCFKEQYDGELTTIARQGSGSACRSLHGGFVKWEQGVKDDGSDSLGIQVVDESHWPEMRVIILVASDGPKHIGSTIGMQQTVETSELIQYRADNVVPKRMEMMEKAIKERDFKTFAEVTMKDSNQFHASCLDTYPPIVYLNETSYKIIEIVHSINEKMGYPIVAYTFDAGPNAVLYLLEEHFTYVYSIMLNFFLPKTENKDDFVRDPQLLGTKILPNCEEFNQITGTKTNNTQVYNMILAKIGQGASIVEYSNN